MTARIVVDKIDKPLSPKIAEKICVRSAREDRRRCDDRRQVCRYRSHRRSLVRRRLDVSDHDDNDDVDDDDVVVPS